MNKTTLGTLSLAMAALLSACGAATATPTAAPTPLDTPVPTSAPVQTSAPTALDPCTLLTPEEISSLAGTTFGAGEEGTTPGGGKTCTFGANTANVFMVEVAQAPDVATAQTYKKQFVADLEARSQQLASAGLKVTELPNFADGAVIGTLNLDIAGITINGSAMGVLKGTVFFGYSDVVKGGAAPTTEALQAEAQTVLGRLP
jgi:hypothetical protein